MVSRFHSVALAESTFQSYNSGWHSYQTFCARFTLPLLPVDEETLQRYVAYMATRVGYSTIKVYLCGIQYFSLMQGFSTSISGMNRLYYLLRGIRRSQGTFFTRPRRRPITLNHLLLINHRLQLLRYTELQNSAGSPL